MGYSKRGSVGWGEDLYIIWCPEAGVVKIGRSCNCERRFKQISLSCPFLHMELTAALAPGAQRQSAPVATLAQYVPAEPVMISMPKQVRKRQPKAESVSNSPG